MNLGFLRCLLALAAAFSLAPPPLDAQEPGSELTVYLLTMGAGDEVWEKFGHNAIWIHDARNESDVAYHWGLFDFADKDFIPRFVQGRMRYSMGAFDMVQTVEQYRRANRTVWAQELNLSPMQRQALSEFVAWNNRPENRHYRYDYYRDNCSTRVRDALDRALGGLIRAASGSVPSRSTYRFHTSRVTQDDLPIFSGIMLGLGEPVDREISAWEEMFLPVRMMDRFRSIRVSRNGTSEPLVRNERVLFQATRSAEDTEVRRSFLEYLALAAVLVALGAAAVKFGGQAGATGVTTVAAVWSIIAGLAGVFVWGLWIFTDHLYSYRNENVLQVTPLSLVLAVLLARVIGSRRKSADYGSSEKGRRSALWFARLIGGLSLLGFVIQIFPVFDQVNGYVIALTLPLHLAVIALLLSMNPMEGRQPLQPL
ncbi:MAG TPA: DUF4105 domain-containing protein [Gemmatimonadaceae bacterium]|nr:DUF4105 domain-containing protein [Gemmatimonadaceae bacterium]